MNLDYEPVATAPRRELLSRFGLIVGSLTATFATTTYCCDRTFDWSREGERFVFWFGVASLVASVICVVRRRKELERWFALVVNAVAMAWFLSVAQLHLFYF